MRQFSAERALSFNLDLLRAIAVALVLAQHLAKRLCVEHFLGMPTSAWGLFGVLLFFVHTCLVLMYSMERSGLKGTSLVLNFATRRIFRIYPLAILAVFAALALHLDSDINGIHGLSYGPFPGMYRIVSNLLLVQSTTNAKSIVNVLWSLPYELQMYAVLPFLFMGICGWQVRRLAMQKAAENRDSRSSNLVWGLVALWGVSVLAAMAQPRFHSLIRLSILVFIPNFLPGVIAYALPHRPRFSGFMWPVFIASLILAFAMRPVPSTGWVLCLLLGFMIPRFREIKMEWLRWGANRIATYSYGIYLSHQFSLWVVFGPLAGKALALRIAVGIVLLIALPVALYYAIEKPMIRVGVRLAEKISVGSSGREVRAGHASAPHESFSREPELAPIALAMPEEAAS